MSTAVQTEESLIGRRAAPNPDPELYFSVLSTHRMFIVASSSSTGL